MSLIANALCSCIVAKQLLQHPAVYLITPPLLFPTPSKPSNVIIPVATPLFDVSLFISLLPLPELL